MPSSLPQLSYREPTPRRRIAAFALAVVLPIFSAALYARFSELRSAPFAIYFVSIAIAATLGGAAPALVAVAASVISRHFYLVWVYHRQPSFSFVDLLGTGVLLGCAIVITIMTEASRKSSQRLQAALNSLQERTDALVDSLHSSKCASWIIDLDSGKSARWYSGSYQVFGRPFSEIEEANSLVTFLHPDDRPRLAGLVRHMRTSDEPIVFEFRAPWPNGEVHWLEARSTRVPGKPCVWRGVTVDITEHKLAEIALIQAEKLAAMGRLASTVAHEVNNPLEAVTNLLYLIRADKFLTPETRSYLETAERELSRLADITRLTLGFVRINAPASTVELVEVLEDVLSIFRHRYGLKNIRIERNFQPGVAIYIAPHELRQIITNLVSNAIDALSQPGSVLSLRIFTEQDSAVVLVEDNGSGIDAAALSRIFEPFFTTKDDVGTGIGLWVTRELVEKNGGRITASSGDLGNGMKTQFRVEFPIAVATALPQPSPTLPSVSR